MNRRTALVWATLAGVAVAALSAETALSQEKVTLTYLASQGWVYDAEQQLGKKFEEQTGIAIDYQIVPADQYFNLLRTKLNSGEAPDIFGGQSGVTDLKLQYNVEKNAVDLSNEPWASKLDPLVAAQSTVNGKLYGMWWEGLSPQELYGGAMIPPPDGLQTSKDVASWFDYESGDNKWTEVPPLANPIFVRNWYRRCKQLIDKYEPDLLYFDNFDLPLGQAGLDIAAHYYNASVARRGSLDVVLNTKELSPDRQGALVEDVERGYRAEVVPHGSQTQVP